MAIHKVKISEIGERAKGSTDFGYRVENNVQWCRALDYENRARLVGISNQYILEEKNAIGVCTSQFIAKTVTRGYKKADEKLYQMAKQAVKRTLEELVPEVVDKTQIFQAAQEKKSNRRKD